MAFALPSFLRTALPASALVLSFGLAPPALAELDAAAAPAANFDLSHWKLTLPVDADDSTTGKAAEIMPSQLTAAPGYSSSWFYTAANGAMTFWAPNNGAKTANAKYPRSELRELLDPNDDSVNWTVAGNSVLNANLRVTQVPTSGKVVIGQIHGHDASPLVKLQYEYSATSKTGKVTALINVTPDATSPLKYTLAQNVGLSKRFSYQIKVWNSGGVAKLYLLANSNPTISWTVDAAWYGMPMYFKAGSYSQEASSSATIGGATEFYVLAATHPNAGIKVSTTALSTALLSLGVYSQLVTASGGAGQYQWKVVSGQLPQGLTLSPDGLISGVLDPLVLEAGVTHTVTFMVTDAHNNSAAKTLKITVAP